MTHDPATQDGELSRPIARTFANARMPLAYVEWPRPGAPLLVLLHGSRDHSRSWDPIARALQRTHHVVAPDLRGHSDSA
jgi:pimeloyl-ACP methyl ester carboxylesterase